MVKNEDLLEELYELLTLYFEFSQGGDLVKPFGQPKKVEPQLDRVILREAIFAKITYCVMKLKVDI